jgi:NAD(P)-dependent dehydrogenase (short-subunit alcohol dehydrogenase family)
MNEIPSPVALVTGSSRGIGFAIASSLLDSGFNVIINGRKHTPQLDKSLQGLQEKGCVKAVCFDVSNIDEQNKALSRVFEAFGRVDCLVNNAGISVDVRKDIFEVTPESFDHQIDANLRSHFFLTQAVAKRMVKESSNSFRSIINISSSNAVAASINRAEYCIAKSGVSMLTKLFALRLAPENINVYEIRPGLIKTDMTLGVEEYYENKLQNGFSPINRWGRPEDIAKAVSEIAKGKMAFATGEAIHLDGGLLLPHY